MKPSWSAHAKCEAARWFDGKLPQFKASETDASGVVLVAGKWVGGDKRPIYNMTLHPVDVRQGVC